MLNALKFQLVALLLVVLGSWFFSGGQATQSALWGGLCSLVPNALFALRLHGVVRKAAAGQKGHYAASFFMGEFMKIAATVGMLAVVVKLVPELHWPAFLLGLAATLHAGFFAFWKKS